MPIDPLLPIRQKELKFNEKLYLDLDTALLGEQADAMVARNVLIYARNHHDEPEEKKKEGILRLFGKDNPNTIEDERELRREQLEEKIEGYFDLPVGNFQTSIEDIQDNKPYDQRTGKLYIEYKYEIDDKGHAIKDRNGKFVSNPNYPNPRYLTDEHGRVVRDKKGNPVLNSDLKEDTFQMEFNLQWQLERLIRLRMAWIQPSLKFIDNELEDIKVLQSAETGFV